MRMYEIMEKVKITCEVCERNSKETHRFRVSVPADYLVLNIMVSLELMSLESDTVLQALEFDKKFGEDCL